MDEIEKKIKRVNNPSQLMNWTRQNFERFDETRSAILRIADNPPKNSLAPIHRLCSKLANRGISYDEAIASTDNYSGYLRMSADEILPAFYDFLVTNQIETVPDLMEDKFFHPIGRRSDYKVKSIRIAPTYVAVRGEMLTPTFVVGWTKFALNPYQLRLVSTLIREAVLTRQPYIGSDAEILSLRRQKYLPCRKVERWRVSQFADLTNDQLQEQFDRYDLAVREVVEELKSRR